MDVDKIKLMEFLKEYVALCKSHGCYILSDGEEVEAVIADKDVPDDPWGVILTTQRKRDRR